MCLGGRCQLFLHLGGQVERDRFRGLRVTLLKNIKLQGITSPLPIKWNDICLKG